jgi:hypothetical protein
VVTPEQLLALATSLALSGDEVAWRASASRAYYASFHHLRRVVDERVGPTSRGTAEDHALIANGIELLDAAAAAAFVELRRERNSADYTIDAPFSKARGAAACYVAAILLRI